MEREERKEKIKDKTYIIKIYKCENRILKAIWYNINKKKSSNIYIVVINIQYMYINKKMYEGCMKSK